MNGVWESDSTHLKLGTAHHSSAWQADHALRGGEMHSTKCMQAHAALHCTKCLHGGRQALPRCVHRVRPYTLSATPAAVPTWQACGLGWCLQWRQHGPPTDSSTGIRCCTPPPQQPVGHCTAAASARRRLSVGVYWLLPANMPPPPHSVQRIQAAVWRHARCEEEPWGNNKKAAHLSSNSLCRVIQLHSG